ncbi:hypothetical protein SynBIOSE41_03432 [Synechococcus sp. BIOS-E4-1]|nr:hypothetical protein SynBIOSE41_03432 [Synechococcus sp. BIOS-E4-1]
MEGVARFGLKFSHIQRQSWIERINMKSPALGEVIATAEASKPMKRGRSMDQASVRT